MELKKESMQILKEKSRAKSQITFDEDFNVPDAKPDAGRLIQNKGRIIMDDVRLTDGKGILTGNLQEISFMWGKKEESSAVLLQNFHLRKP